VYVHDHSDADFTHSICPECVKKIYGGDKFRRVLFRYMQRPAPPSSAEIAAAWKPWIETCIELFGPDRCMFESNFPVDKITSGYGVLWNAFKVLAAKASPSEKTALFSGTASRVYKLALT